jgi:EmrB/QacA subfamily drug resistance transporter
VDGPGGPAEGATVSSDQDPKRWHALWVTLVAGFMTLLDISIVAVALPSMQHDLGASASEIQWVVSGYALTFGLVLVLAGRLGDLVGRRPVYVGALAGFVLCSAAAGLAPSPELLIVARLVQGVCAGTLAPQSSALIQELFSGAERGRAFGMFGATVGLSTAVGPLTGGVILALASGPHGWRWIFFVNVPIGLVALPLAARWLPRARHAARSTFDVIGVLLLGLAVLAVLFPLATADDGGLSRYWWLFPAAAVGGVAFAWWERRVAARGGDPVLDPRLFTRTRGFASGTLLATVYFVGFSGLWLILAIYLQDALGYTPLQSGLATTPFSVGSAVAAALAGRVIGRWGRGLTVVGLLGVIAGLSLAAAALQVAPGHLAGLLAAPALLIAGVGSGLVVSPNVTLALRDVPVPLAGAAGGALQTGQRVGAAVGTAILPALYYVLLNQGAGASTAIALAVVCAVAFTAVALVVALLDRHRDGAPAPAAPHAA